MGAVLGAILTTMFVHGEPGNHDHRGCGIEEPGQADFKPANSVIWRIGLFYLVSIFIVVALVPWNDPTLANLGSYQTVLERMGIPNAENDRRHRGSGRGHQLPELGAVYLVAHAVLLGKRGDAPAMSTRVNKSGTPYWAVMLSTGAAFLCTFANYVAPAAVFEFLLASSAPSHCWSTW